MEQNVSFINRNPLLEHFKMLKQVIFLLHVDVCSNTFTIKCSVGQYIDKNNSQNAVFPSIQKCMCIMCTTTCTVSLLISPK